MSAEHFDGILPGEDIGGSIKVDGLEVDARSDRANDERLNYIPSDKVHHIDACAEDNLVKDGQHDNLEVKEIDKVYVDSSRNVGKIDEGKYISLLEADQSINFSVIYTF